MQSKNYYTILQIHHRAPQTAIKQAYRRLVKQYHPDLNHDLDNHETIAQINVAYEVLSNPNTRASYDRSIGILPPESNTPIKSTNKTTKYAEDEKLQIWLTKVYEPVCEMLREILGQLQDQVDALADDPFDDDLMSVFLAYLEKCRQICDKSQHLFRCYPNPATTARSAEYLFHCLNQLGDGIEELYYFTNNFDDHHLHTGIELWRIAEEMFVLAQSEMFF